MLIADDLLATGGTMRACIELIRQLGGEVVGATVLIELAALGGRQFLADRAKNDASPTTLQSVLTY